MKNTNTKYAPFVAREKKEAQYYKGIKQKTDSAVHEQLVCYIRDTFGDEPLKILDWGCGQGALAERLSDEGHEVVAVDMDQNEWKGSSARFVQLDFNQQQHVSDFVSSHKDSFDLIVSVEVIEHIESPWSYLRNLKEFGCDVIVSTPNISSWWGRFWFFVTGELWGFGQNSWNDPGHINPINTIEFNNMLSDIGFKLVRTFPGGCLPIIWLYNWKRALISLAILPLRLLMKGQKDGWILCYHAAPRK